MVAYIHEVVERSSGWLCNANGAWMQERSSSSSCSMEEVVLVFFPSFSLKVISAKVLEKAFEKCF